MIESDKRAFRDLIAALMEAFQREATNGIFISYWLGLRDLELDAVREAVASVFRECKHCPPPAELRELAIGIRSEDRAIAAWSDVQRASSVSYMADLDFGDTTINAVVRHLGGRASFFSRLVESVESEKWLRVEFLKAYQSLSRLNVSEEARQVLIGEADHEPVAGRRSRVRRVTIGCDDARARLGARSTETGSINQHSLNAKSFGLVLSPQ